MGLKDRIESLIWPPEEEGGGGTPKPADAKAGRTVTPVGRPKPAAAAKTAAPTKAAPPAKAAPPVKAAAPHPAPSAPPPVPSAPLREKEVKEQDRSPFVSLMRYLFRVPDEDGEPAGLPDERIATAVVPTQLLPDVDSGLNPEEGEAAIAVSAGLDPDEGEAAVGIAVSARDTESQARRAAAYERVVATCPMPIHPESLPLPGGLRLREDEFLVAATSRPYDGHQLSVTTQRLIYTRGPAGQAQLVVYLSDICDIVFHDDGSLTIGTASGRWERLLVNGNNLAASRDGLLEVVHYARRQRSALPGGLDELVDLRDRGALGTADYESRRSAVTGGRRKRHREVEVAGRATRHTAEAAEVAEAAETTDDAEAGTPAEVPAQSPDEAR